MASTSTIVTHYDFKLTPDQVKLIGTALQKLPMEVVHATVMELEKQLQEQNFKINQQDVQQAVSDANVEALALAAASGIVPVVEPLDVVTASTDVSTALPEAEAAD